MNKYHAKRWLVAYDIRDKKRLGRVYRFLSKHALPTQYSVFLLEASEVRRAEIIAGITARIDPSEDDVRVYHVPASAQLWALGTQFKFDGCTVVDETLSYLMVGGTADAIDDQTDLENGDRHGDIFF